MRTLRSSLAAILLVLLPSIARAQRPVEPPWTPPPYADTSKFSEIELRVGPDSTLPATLSLPRGQGPFAAVVLVHGSGPSDRNEAVGPNRTFQDLAWGLASEGIAVLRYEKRSHVRPGEFFGKAFTVEEEVIRDVRDVVTRLARRPEIDPRRIVVFGHSEGGILAPRIALEDGRLAAIVIAEGASEGELLAMMDTQMVYIRSVHPEDSTRIDRVRHAVATGRTIVDANLAVDSMQRFFVLGAPISYYADLRRYDPAATTRALDLPVLVLQGGRDYQVTPSAMEAWRRAVGERPNVRIETFPALNHFMMPGIGVPDPVEYSTPSHVAPALIDSVAAWVRGLTPRPTPHP